MNPSSRSTSHSPASSFSPSTCHPNGITRTPQTIRTNEARKVRLSAGGIAIAPAQNASLGNSRFIDGSSTKTGTPRRIATPNQSTIRASPRSLRKSPVTTTKPLPTPTPNPTPNLTPPSRPFSPVAAVAAGSQALRSFFFSSSKASSKGKEKEIKKGKETVRQNENTLQGRTLKWGLGKLGTTKKDVQRTEEDTIRSPPRHHAEREGIWQPPSLRKGSISQPQLRLFLDPEEAARRAREKRDEDYGEGTYGRLGLISGKRRPTAVEVLDPPKKDLRPFPSQDGGKMEVFAPTSAGTRRDVVDKTERAQKRSIKRSLTLFKNAIRSKATTSETKQDVESAEKVELMTKNGESRGQDHRSDGGRSPVSSRHVPTRPTTARRSSHATLNLNHAPGLRQRGPQSRQPSPTTSDGQLPSRPNSTTPRRQSSPSPATGSRGSSRAPTPLSEAEETKRTEEHYMLRIAVTYLVRTVLPHVISKTSGSQKAASGSNSTGRSTVRGSPSIDREGALRSVLEERLRSLQRMERAWGSAWIARGPTGGGLRLSERTRAKERRALRDALRDGVVLCYLLNRSQGSLEPLIPRISLEDLQFSRDSNIQNFVNACHGLPSVAIEGMVVSDISDPSTAAVNRIVLTLIALAKLAGPDLNALSPSYAVARGSVRGSDSSRAGSALLRPMTELPESTPSSPEDPVMVTPATPQQFEHVKVVKQTTSPDRTLSASPLIIESSSPSTPSSFGTSRWQIGATGKQRDRMTLESSPVKPILRMRPSLAPSSTSGTTSFLYARTESVAPSAADKRSSTPSLVHSSSATRSSLAFSDPSESRAVSFDLDAASFDMGNMSPPESPARAAEQTRRYHISPAPTNSGKSYSLGNGKPAFALAEAMAEPTTGKAVPQTPRMGIRRHSAQGKIYVPKGAPGRETPVSENFSPSTPSPISRRRSQVESEPTENKRIASKDVVVVRGKVRTSVYQLGNCIGRGQFGVVWRALDIATGHFVAVKRIAIAGLAEAEIEQLMKEVDLLQRLEHPGIIRYEGMARDTEHLNIVLEYIEGGSLGTTVKSFGRLNEKLVAGYAAKIIEGLDYLHKQGVVHCDLKAANILTTKRGNIKLSDFGVSLNLRTVENSKNEVAGSPNWMAPEVIELKGATPAADIWSLGCTVIELLTGKPPYSDLRNDMAVLFRIVEDDMPPLPQGASESLKNFLTTCFNKDPAARPTAEQLFESEWVKWGLGLHEIIRGSDSIPFLRRISMEMPRIDRLAQIRKSMEMELVKQLSRPNSSAHSDSSTAVPSTPTRRRAMQFASSSSQDLRAHTLIKTKFSTPLMCRICMELLKRNAVICSECGLISHSTCAQIYPSSCDQGSVWTTGPGSRKTSLTSATSQIGGELAVRPMLSRVSLSTPVVATITREQSEDSESSQDRGSDRAEMDRLRALEKLTGAPPSGPNLTELPTSRFLPGGKGRRHVSAPPPVRSNPGAQSDDGKEGAADAGHQSSDCVVM